MATPTFCLIRSLLLVAIDNTFHVCTTPLVKHKGVDNHLVLILTTQYEVNHLWSQGYLSLLHDLTAAFHPFFARALKREVFKWRGVKMELERVLFWNQESKWKGHTGDSQLGNRWWMGFRFYCWWQPEILLTSPLGMFLKPWVKNWDFNYQPLPQQVIAGLLPTICPVYPNSPGMQVIISTSRAD